jgi:hypothetical protein
MHAHTHIFSLHPTHTVQVVKGACLAPSSSPDYHGPVHAVVGMAGQGLSKNRKSRGGVHVSVVCDGMGLAPSSSSSSSLSS